MNKMVRNLPEHVRVYNKIRDMVLFGDLVPSQPVTILGLIDAVDAGMTPVREALRRLTSEGALQTLGNRRIVVPKLTLSQLEEIYFARLAIEPKIAEISCQNQDSSLVKRLEEIDERLNTAIETNDVKAYLLGNYAFHFELYRAANTPILTDMAQSLWLRIGPSLRAVCASQGSSILPDQHEETVKGLAQQDARLVSKAIAEDIRQGMDHVRQAAIFNNSETEN